MEDWDFYPNRTVCSVLEELRTCYKTRNFAPMLSLIEEVQYMANRMEAALNDQRDVREWQEERSKLKNEIRQLRTEKKELKNDNPQDS